MSATFTHCCYHIWLACLKNFTVVMNFINIFIHKCCLFLHSYIYAFGIACMWQFNERLLQSDFKSCVCSESNLFSGDIWTNSHNMAHTTNICHFMPWKDNHCSLQMVKPWYTYFISMATRSIRHNNYILKLYNVNKFYQHFHTLSFTMNYTFLWNGMWKIHDRLLEDNF